MKKIMLFNLVCWGMLSFHLDRLIRDNYPSQENIRQLAVTSFIRGCLLQRPDFLRCQTLANTHDKELKSIMENK